MSSPEEKQEVFVDKHLKRNIVVQLGHGLFGQTGFRLFSAPAFLPVYLIYDFRFCLLHFSVCLSVPQTSVCG